MKKTPTSYNALAPGSQLWNLMKFSSFGGLFLSLTGTVFSWAGSDSFHVSSMVWKISLLINITMFFAVWLSYLGFKSTDKLLGNGILSLFLLFSLFWLFGFSMFYFYFLFAPMNLWLRLVPLLGVSILLLHRAYLISSDIKRTFKAKESLFDRIYIEDENAFTFTRDAVRLVEKARPKRSPFTSIHTYATILLTPFVFVLNRILTPITGDGHGVFMIVAFISVPLMLWGVEIVVQTIFLMIYYPLKIHSDTGKDVLMKNW
jgi:hypothetical protein